MRSRTFLAPLLTASVLVVGLATPSGAARFDLEPGSTTDTVYFRSTASLEFIEGKSTAIDGGFEFDPDSPDTPVAGLLRVDLRTLKTGIGLRDEHMRDRHLETDTYPYAFFELTRIDGIAFPLVQRTLLPGTAQGWFYIHGVKRQIDADIECRFGRGEGGTMSLDVRATFVINLEDYKIKRPKALFLKLAETIEVEVVFKAQTNRESASFEAPEWPAAD